MRAGVVLFLFAHETGRLARSIASGQGFSSPLHALTGPTAFQAPLFPFLLAGVFRLFGIYTDTSAFVIPALNSLFSALTCLTVFYIGEKTFGRTAANLAGWTWALLPTAVILSVHRVELAPLVALLLSLMVLLTLHLEFIAQHPGAFARLTLLRISYWWSSNWQIRGTGRRAEWAAAGIWFGFAMQSFLALLGLVLALRNRRQGVVPYALLLAVYPLAYYVVYYQLRYRHPLEPVMVVLCVYAVQQTLAGKQAAPAAPARAAQPTE